MVAFCMTLTCIMRPLALLTHSKPLYVCSMLLFACAIDELLEMSFRNAAWRTYMLKSETPSWKITYERGLPLDLFKVQYGRLHAHKWREGLKTTCDRDLPLAPFKVQYGGLHAHKWPEGLKTTCGRDLLLALFRVQYGSLHAHKWCENLKTTWGHAH